MKSLLVWEEPSCNVFHVTLVGVFIDIKPTQLKTTETSGFFQCPCLSAQCGSYEKHLWAVVYFAGFQKSDSSCTVQLFYCPRLLALKWRDSNALMGPSFRQQYCIPSSPCVSWESNFRFVRSVFSQHHSEFFANISSDNVCPRSVLKKGKTRTFICKVSFKFLRSSGHSN